MISISQCFEFTDLAPDEIILGVSFSEHHRTLLASYLLNLDRGAATVREMIIADLRSFLAMGARKRAADLLVVLRMFLSCHPLALCVVRCRSEFGCVPFASNIVYEDHQDICPFLRMRSSVGSTHRAENTK